MARVLVGIFLGIALVQSIFIGLISYDVTNAAASAKHEYKLVGLSQQISDLMQIGKRGHAAYMMARRLGKPVDYHPIKAAFEDNLAHFKSSIAEAGIDWTVLEGLEKSVNKLIGMMTDAMENAGELSVEDRNRLFFASGDLFHATSVAHNYVHNIISKSPMPATALGLTPQNLLYLWMGLSALSFASIILLIDKLLTGPVSKLAADCENIRFGRLMKEAKSNSSEIAELQNSFFRMSKIVSETEMRRKNYVEILKDVQSSALSQVKEWISELIELCSTQEKLCKKLKSTEKNLEGLLRLTDSMSDALSGKSDSLIPVRKQISARGLIDSISLTVEMLMQKRQITLQVSGEDVQFNADQELLGRVLQNLLSNAIKYSPDGGNVNVEIAQEDDKFCVFKVKDNGPGISEQQRKKLFSRFTQVEASDGTRREGSGLGLLIAKQIVEAHGGEIACDSHPGVGTCFWFKIPLKSIESQSAENKREALGNDKRQKQGSIKHVISAVLAIYLMCQLSFALCLQNMFTESTHKAADLSLEKELLFHSQELATIYFRWTNQVLTGMITQNTLQLADGQELLKDQSRPAKWILEHVKSQNRLTADMKKVCSSQKHLLLIVDYMNSHPDASNSISALKIMRKYFDYQDTLDHAIWDAIAIQKKAVQASFAFADTLRNQLLAVLAIAAAVNMLLLGAISLLSLRVIDEVSQLQNKASAFSVGLDISPSLAGTNELSFLDKRLCELAADLKAAEVQRQELLAVINHDLRTPLSAVLNGIELISQGVFGPIDEKERELLLLVDGKLKSLLKQINYMLLIEKIDSGSYEKIAEDVSIRKTVEEVLKQFEKAAANNQIEIDLFLAADLPETILAEQKLLSYLLEILLSNAIHATPQNSTISLTIEKQGKEVFLKVKDAGSGIQDNLLQQIFERFRVLEGKPLTGLGLPLASRICKLYAGSISINSSAQGTELIASLA